MPIMTKVVETYLGAIVAHDWDTVRSLVAEDVVRLGPYGDDFRGRDAYVGFLADLMPQLEGYALELVLVTYVDGGRRAFAELTERVTVNGTPTVTAEVLVFELDADRRISRVEIYIRRA